MSKTNYTLTLDNESFQKHVVRADFKSFIDEPSELRVRVAFGAKENATLSGDKFSAKANLKVYERGLFAGHLVDVQSQGVGEYELVYTDPMHNLNRITESDFFKGVTLEDYLRRVCQSAGLSAKFKGSFSKVLPAFNVVGTPILDHIQKLSGPYGFLICSRPFTSEVHFLRLDQFAEAKQVDLKKEKCVSEMPFHQTSRDIYRAAEVRFFDSSSQKSEKKEVSQDQIYSPLGFLRQSGSFEKRLSRPLSKGREERLAIQTKQFSEGPDLLAGELSKQALLQEQLQLQMYALPALIGDKLNVSGSRLSDSEGNYLVRGLKVEIASSQPLVQLNLTRA